VCGLVAKKGFEVMGLQEAQANQIDDMLKTLGAGWAYVGTGREDGARKGEHSCIFYKKERFEVSESGTFWLSETPEIPGSKSWNTACTRVCTWADMRDKLSGKTFVFFNTHLDHISKEAREKGMELIIRRMTEKAQGRPVFLTGDMNSTPSDASIKTALAALRDAKALSRAPHEGPAVTFNSFKYNPNPQGQPIDYIFVSAGIDVLTHATIADSENQLYPSDHFPVAADVAVE
jgi:endonuclease/exonuclease/phosphatase family metal-dependent hydrolase